MKNLRLGSVEARFADIVWQNVPIATGALTKICEKELSWKRTTTYTVLKRLCDGGLFENDHGTVRALMSREDFYTAQGEQLIEESFSGSLPSFLAAFTARKALTDEEIDEIQALIDSFGKRKP